MFTKPTVLKKLVKSAWMVGSYAIWTWVIEESVNHVVLNLEVIFWTSVMSIEYISIELIVASRALLIPVEIATIMELAPLLYAFFCVSCLVFLL